MSGQADRTLSGWINNTDRSRKIPPWDIQHTNVQCMWNKMHKNTRALYVLLVGLKTNWSAVKYSLRPGDLGSPHRRQRYSVGIVRTLLWARREGSRAVFFSWSLDFCLRRYPPSDGEHHLLVPLGPGVQHGQTEISDNDVRCHQWLTNQISGAPLHWRCEHASVSSRPISSSSSSLLDTDRTQQTSGGK